MKKNYISFEKLMLMVKIYFIPNINNLNYTKLSHFIHVSQSSSIFTEIIKVLKEEKIINEMEVIGNVKIISINRPLLKEFMGECKVTKDFCLKFLKPVYNITVFTEFTGGFKHE